MDKETIEYIITYYNTLFTEDGRKAMRHIHSLIKFDCDQGRVTEHPRYNIYIRNGWLTEDSSVLELLKDGYDTFKANIARRILKDQSEKVFFNYCSKCEKLARTPDAKQCRFCENDWHEENM